MPRHPIKGGDSWLDIASYGRRGPSRRDHLSPAQVAAIERTVRRTPEVMVKMLNRGGQNLGAVARHLKYLDRDGELEIETDVGERLRGQGAGEALIDDWDLDLDEQRPTSDLRRGTGGKPPKLVHKMVFSMPAGTPPEKVLAAVKVFAREEFGAQHRYAMVLHTDEPHPHVHVVVKAIGYDGRRLNIRRATLREWRRDFARHLRAQGVDANATDKVVRGSTRPKLSDEAYRVMERGASRHNHEDVSGVQRTTASEALAMSALRRTRTAVERGWAAVAELLDRQGQQDLAWSVRRFVDKLPPIRTDQERLRLAGRSQDRDRPPQELAR
jgi:hypothetical protein